MKGRWWKRGTRLDHKDPARRLDAVQGLTPDEAATEQPALVQLAQTDPAREVRVAAVELLNDHQALEALLADEVTTETAARRIAMLTGDGQNIPAASDFRVLQARIEQCTPELLPGLLPDISEPELAAELALRMRGAERQQVLDSPLLRNEEGLIVLARAARGRDKSTHRHARDRLEQIRSARSLCEQTLERARELDTSIARLLHGQDPGAMPAADLHKLDKLRQMRAACQQQFIEQHQQLQHAGGGDTKLSFPDDPLTGVTLSQAEPALDLFEPLVPRLHALQQKLSGAADPAPLRQQRDALVDEWLSLADKGPPRADQHKVFAEVTSHFNELHNAWERVHALLQHPLEPIAEPGTSLTPTQAAQQHRQYKAWLQRWRPRINKVKWPSELPIPAPLEPYIGALQQVESGVQVLQQQLRDAEQTLQNLIKQAESALDAGQVKQAVQHLRDARGLQKAGLHQHDRELTALSAQVDEYRDWQRFATNPKRQQLLEQVKDLAEHPQEPQIQAERLRMLRAQWQQLGRPHNAEESTQVETFDTLADKAFEPCKEYFAEAARQRADNLRQREALCDQLEAYLSDTDWTQADLRAADQIMRQARTEWRQHHPCDRKALKPVLNRFESLQDALYGKLKAAWDANGEDKQRLIEQARELASAEAASPLGERIEQAKTLQQQWRTCGPTSRGREQKLWREFREACDAVFALRDAERDQHHAQQQARAEALEAAVQQLELAVEHAQAQTEPQVSRKQLSQLLDAVTTADARPSGALRGRIEQARSRYEALLRAQQQAEERQQLAQWAQWDSQVSAAEQQGADIHPPHGMFGNRCSGTAEPQDWLRLVIEAEIAADIPGPSDEQQQRMELQVELMNAGIKPHDISYRDMLQRWCEAGPKDASADQLRDRFFAALQLRLTK